MKIFISYRRDDSSGYAGRLFDYLKDRFDPSQIFMDIDTIKAGEDFRKAIEFAVGTCDVVIVLIGKRWLSAADAEGNRRLDDPKDWVRTEIASALANTNVKKVIPVLIQDATMPSEDQLPDGLKELAYRNAIELNDRRFEYDVKNLINEIEGSRKFVKSAVKIGGEFLVVAVLVLIFVLGREVIPNIFGRTPTVSTSPSVSTVTEAPTTPPERITTEAPTTEPTTPAISTEAPSTTAIDHTAVPTADIRKSSAADVVNKFFMYINEAEGKGDKSLANAWALFTNRFKEKPIYEYTCNIKSNKSSNSQLFSCFTDYWSPKQVEYELYDCGKNIIIAKVNVHDKVKPTLAPTEPGWRYWRLILVPAAHQVQPKIDSRYGVYYLSEPGAPLSLCKK